MTCHDLRPFLVVVLRFVLSLVVVEAELLFEFGLLDFDFTCV